MYAVPDVEEVVAVAKSLGMHLGPDEAVLYRKYLLEQLNALDTFVRGRTAFSLDQWRELLLRSIGFEPSRFTVREQDVLIARMVPFVVTNYNAVELGPRILLRLVVPECHGA